MKKRIFVAVCVMVVCVMGAVAQVSEMPDYTKPVLVEESMRLDVATGDVSLVVAYAGKKKGELWSWCRRWMAETFRNYNNIKQLEDREGGMLICNYTNALYQKGVHNGYNDTWRGTNKWKMTITCKDERLRVQLTEYAASWSVSDGRFTLNDGPMSFSKAQQSMGEELFNDQYTTAVSYMVGEIGTALEKYAGEEDF